MAADEISVLTELTRSSVADVAADEISVGGKVNSSSVADSLSVTENRLTLPITDKSSAATSVANNAQYPSTPDFRLGLNRSATR